MDGSIHRYLHSCKSVGFSPTGNPLVKCINIPDIGVLFDELLHEALAFHILHYDNINSSLHQISFASNEGMVLANNYAGNLV